MHGAQAQGLKSVLLINPNTSARTTAMMVEIAQAAAGGAVVVRGATASVGAPMIVNEEQLAASATEVLRIARQEGTGISGIIVSAFGDPGLSLIRNELAVPAVGLCEASMREASSGGRRFGVATVTPGLVRAIGGKAARLGLSRLYAGIRLTEGDPRELAADPVLLEQALAGAVEACIRLDGAEAVIIGGGPLGRAASALEPRFRVPIIAPIAAATARLLRELAVSPV